MDNEIKKEENTEEIVESKIEFMRHKYGKVEHFYSDTVRKLFIAAASVMIVTLPFLTHRLATPPFLSVLAVVIVASLAGFITSRKKWIIVFDFIVSVGGVLVFEYYAIDAYSKYSVTDIFFLTNQILALIFLFSLYFSAKTLRDVFFDK